MEECQNEKHVFSDKTGAYYENHTIFEHIDLHWIGSAVWEILRRRNEK